MRSMKSVQHEGRGRKLGKGGPKMLFFFDFRNRKTWLIRGSAPFRSIVSPNSDVDGDGGDGDDDDEDEKNTNGYSK